MNWIRICVSISDDPAVGRIADLCGIPISEAIGCVVSVFCKLPAHAKNGSLGDISDRTIEHWANWEHDRGHFAAAFRQELCDEDSVVRAWERHNGAAMREADAARERMRDSRRKPKADAKANDSPKPLQQKPERFAEHSENVRGNVRRSFPSNGTRRNEYPPTSPDGSVALPSPPGPKAEQTGALFAEWERQLFAAALPHEAAALEALCVSSFRPAIIGELYAMASGQHLVRGEHAPYREANAADVMRAVSEYACKGREWNTSYFRGVVRRILDRPPEPPDAAQREQEKLARQVAKSVPTIMIETPRTQEEIEAARARREAAMALFKAEAMRNTAGEKRSAEVSSVGGIVSQAVATMVA